MSKNYQGRGLHDKKWDESFKEKKEKEKEGKLYPLLELIKQDKELVLELRNDYLNVYYCGGNLAKISSENSIQFDENYFKGYEWPKYEANDKIEERKKLRKEWIGELKETRDYNSFIIKMKKLMDGYWNWLSEHRGKSLIEKDTQHKLCVCNNEHAEYTVIDLEFQVSTISDYAYVKPQYVKGRFVAYDKKSPRFDVVAVRNSDGQLCVIELKSGCSALYGKSGIGDHADSFEGTIKRNPEPFMKEITNVVEWKKAHCLLPKEFKMSENKPIFIYAYSFKDDDKDAEGNVRSKDEQKKLFIEELKKSKSDCYPVMFLEKDCFELSNAEFY